ncbi:hypothetical protein GCM10012290_05030 [Halolactibacillus alkaliphilus]|uniref:Phage capsid protein n=1 Tax=Halolactibacillus alkaliphilus TaxID=442899 RepID=A0A511WYU5_9BACI|nr:DUF6366 family protein [Halolactibacillus alkaliphilus]GEN55863.1 hypothetical protein HAL01_03270 [Halolactibacillus alkaliphilus]GGN65840.1 hypothetical protein GCM10012290_05030 [Halolactibacillus alkaliphilus]SFO66386.1 hypothetical protein SAMN05720591_10390 [Halolactibacillus alkaliphilus]
MKLEDKSEALNQQERKASPTANSRDALERARYGSTKDLASSLSTKVLGVIILILIAAIFLIALL